MNVPNKLKGGRLVSMIPANVDPETGLVYGSPEAIAIAEQMADMRKALSSMKEMPKGKFIIYGTGDNELNKLHKKMYLKTRNL